MLNNFWRIFYILYFTTYAAEGAFLRCYRSINDYMEVSLKQSSKLVNTSYVKLRQELDIVIHGSTSEINEPIKRVLENLIKVYGDTKSYCALNWKIEASAYIGEYTKFIQDVGGFPLLFIQYLISSAIASHVGTNLGKALLNMAAKGLELDAVYLIGHSEGAHLAGAAGRRCIASGYSIGRITGLDPAKPAIEKHLDKSYAKLVDVVHTNPIMYGTNEINGQIDFWLNYECAFQPGCEGSTLNTLNVCSHDRALYVMADAILYPESLQGRKADRYTQFSEFRNTPDPADVNFIGFHINPNNTGFFYLCTRAKSTYGMGPDGMNPANCHC